MSDFIAIRCRSTGRLLAKINEDGIHLFCKQQNAQHLMTWEKIRQTEAEIIEGTCKNPIYIDDNTETRSR